MFGNCSLLLCAVLLVSQGPFSAVAADEKTTSPATPSVATPPATPSSSPANATWQLSYKFVPGQTVNLLVTHQMTMTTTKGLTSVTAVNTSTANKHFRVVRVDSQGRAVLEPMIDRVRMQAQIGETDPIVYDSRSSKSVPQPFNGVQKTVGKVLAQLTVTPSGKLVSSKVLLPKPIASAVTARQIPVGDDSGSRNFLVVLPPEPVAVGQSWQDKFKIRVQVTRTLTRDIEMLRKYTLESVSRGIATIDLKTAILTPVRDAGIRAQLIQRTPTGTIVFDIDRGLIVSRRLVVDETVIGPFGGDSSLRAKSTRTEKMVGVPSVAGETPDPARQ